MYIPLNPPSKVHTFSSTQTQGFAREPIGGEHGGRDGVVEHEAGDGRGLEGPL